MKVLFNQRCVWSFRSSEPAREFPSGSVHEIEDTAAEEMIAAGYAELAPDPDEEMDAALGFPPEVDGSVMNSVPPVKKVGGQRRAYKGAGSMKDSDNV